MRKISFISLLLISAVLLTGCSLTSQSTPQADSNAASPSPDASSTNQNGGTSMETPQVITTNADMLKETKKATITLDNGLSFMITIYPQVAPKTAANYLNKFSSGYYNNLTFHRVEDWVVQGGDPSGNGTGGGSIPTELNDMPYKKGAVGVARGGDIRVSNDSQFFVVTKDSDFLNGQYTYFGQVTEGFDNVLKVKVGDKIKSVTVE